VKPVPGRVFERLASTPLSASLLVTDFDGTLAPIVADPAAAVALPESLRALAELVRLGLKVVVLSSRPTSFLEARVPIPGVRLLGDNGLDPPSDDEIRSLERFNELATGVIAGRPGVRLVPEAVSTSVHFRAAPEVADGLFEEVSSLASRLNLVASRGRMVVEVRPHGGTKAGALDAVIRSLRPRCVVFAGDDEGDRTAFELISRFEGAHLAIGIRSDETPAELFTLCDVVLESPAELATFLGEWIRVASRPDVPGGRPPTSPRR
jgi:trehalose 6-phosphate phosphatase